jgi:hypothetical protein
LIIDAEKKQSFAELQVMARVSLLLETGNPVFAWEAYQTARRFAVPIPEEVLEYFDGAAG